MNKKEAIEYLQRLKSRDATCFACVECSGNGCKLEKVIELLDAPLEKRLLEVLKEVHDGKR